MSLGKQTTGAKVEAYLTLQPDVIPKPFAMPKYKETGPIIQQEAIENQNKTGK